MHTPIDLAGASLVRKEFLFLSFVLGIAWLSLFERVADRARWAVVILAGVYFDGWIGLLAWNAAEGRRLSSIE